MSRCVRWNSTVENRSCFKCSKSMFTDSPTMPAFCVTDGPTRSGVSRSAESSVNVASMRSSGNSTR